MNYGIECPDGTITFPNGRIGYENDGWIWKWGRKKLNGQEKNKFIEFRKSPTKKSGWSVCYKNYLKVDNENNPIDRAAPHKNLIQGILNSDAASQMKEIFGTNKDFSYAKPTELIKDLLSLCDIQNCGIVLDFFAGSGTTGQAVLELNAEDGGGRRFILCTSNEITGTTPNGIARDVASKRLKRVMTGVCYDGAGNFKWLERHRPLGGNLDVYELDSVAGFEATEGKTPFDVIDETLYGQEKFATVKEKVEWVCDHFEHTQNIIESEEEWLKRKEDR